MRSTHPFHLYCLLLVCLWLAFSCSQSKSIPSKSVVVHFCNPSAPVWDWRFAILDQPGLCSEMKLKTQNVLFSPALSLAFSSLTVCVYVYIGKLIKPRISHVLEKLYHRVNLQVSFYFLFWGIISLSCSSWPWTHFVTLSELLTWAILPYCF